MTVISGAVGGLRPHHRSDTVPTSTRRPGVVTLSVTPLKDTSGPALNIIMELMTILCLSSTSCKETASRKKMVMVVGWDRVQHADSAT